jgi:hypothetical protein
VTHHHIWRRPRRKAPDVRRAAGGPAEPDRPVRGPDYGDLGQAFPAWSRPRKGAILQPPEPEIPQILQRVMDYDAD